MTLLRTMRSWIARRVLRRYPEGGYETYDGSYRDGGSTRGDRIAGETSMRRANPSPPQFPMGSP